MSNRNTVMIDGKPVGGNGGTTSSSVGGGQLQVTINEAPGTVVPEVTKPERVIPTNILEYFNFIEADIARYESDHRGMNLPILEHARWLLTEAREMADTIQQVAAVAQALVIQRDEALAKLASVSPVQASAPVGATPSPENDLVAVATASSALTTVVIKTKEELDAEAAAEKEAKKQAALAKLEKLLVELAEAKAAL